MPFILVFRNQHVEDSAPKVLNAVSVKGQIKNNFKKLDNKKFK